MTLAAVFTDECSTSTQALAAAGAAALLAFLVWAVGALWAPYMQRREALKLLPPFDTATQHAVWSLMQTGIYSADGKEVGTAFEVLFHLSDYLSRGVTLEECESLIDRLFETSFGESANPPKGDRPVEVHFIGRLTSLGMMTRQGDVFMLTDFAKAVLHQHTLLEDWDVAPDGTLIQRDPDIPGSPTP